MGSRLGRFATRWFFAVILTAWSVTFGLASYRSRLLLSVIVEHFGWERLLGEGVNPQLPTATMEELFDGVLAAPIVFPTYRDGNVQTVEIAVINELVRRDSPSVLFEIGTFDGRSTSNLAANSPAGAVVYTLDLPVDGPLDTTHEIERGEEKYARDTRVGELFASEELPDRGKIAQLFGDSATFDDTGYRGKVDFVFVDGSHHADYVRNDTELALRLLGDSGGLIVWHDYANAHWPGVTSVLDGYSGHARLRGMTHIEGCTLVFCHVAAS